MEKDLRRRCRRVAIIAGAALLLLGASGPPPRTVPWYDYSAMLKILSDSATLRYPTAGELADFPVLWPTVPVEQNAAFYYAKAVRLLKDKGEAPGSLVSLETYAGDLAALDAWVAANKPALEMAAKAQSRPVFRVPPFAGTLKAILSNWADWAGMLRQLGRCFCDAGLAEELNGKPRAALEDYLACLRTAAQVRSGRIMESEVGCDICTVARRQLDQLVANAALPEVALREIIQACSDAETRTGEIPDSVECEAELTAASLRFAGLRGKIALEILDIATGDSQAIAAARKDAERPVYEVINNPAAQLALGDRQAAAGNVASAAVWKWRVRLAHMDTDLRVLQIRAAIALYQRQHGKWPETLDALCPQFLPRVPLDPFSGKPLHYRIGRRDWIVWTVGQDLTDTGGELFTGEGENRHSKDGIFMSRVFSTIESARFATTNSISASELDQETPADAASQAAQPEVDRLGLTPLHRAANRGDLAAVEALVAKGADVNARALAKQTPLHLAVTKEIAQLLLSKGAQIEARDRWGRTPLFWAAGAGRKGVVEALLAAGAQADAPEVAGTDPSAGLSELLSQLPANMRAGSPATTSLRTPITRAAEQGHEDIAELLRKHLAEHPAKP